MRVKITIALLLGCYFSAEAQVPFNDWREREQQAIRSSTYNVSTVKFVGECIWAKATDKKDQSYLFAFRVGEVLSGTQPEKTVVFEVYENAKGGELYSELSCSECSTNDCKVAPSSYQGYQAKGSDLKCYRKSVNLEVEVIRTVDYTEYQLKEYAIHK
jgi:hypothetical protein